MLKMLFNWFGVSSDNLVHLLKPVPNPEGKNKAILPLLGAFLMPIKFAGALFGYIQGYKRSVHPKDGHSPNITSKSNGEEANARQLIMPDKLCRYSGDNILAFFESKPPTYFTKQPNYTIRLLDGRAEDNPYI